MVIQESSVLDIFFDVLALEFVESMDDIVFSLAKRGGLLIYQSPFLHLEMNAANITNASYTFFFSRIFGEGAQSSHREQTPH